MTKKKFLLIILLLSLFCIKTLNAQNKKERLQLTEILEKLHSKFECNFSYVDKDLEDLLIEPPPESYSLPRAIEYIQQNTPLLFNLIGNNFIAITRTGNDGFAICGYLIDINTNQPIESVVIQTKNGSTVSNENGYFKLNKVEAESIVTIRHLGYITVTEYSEKLQSKQCEIIFLEPKVEDLNEIILTNYLTNGINKVIDGSININYKNFGTVPGLIETDVLQTIQAMPGFQSVSETVSNLNIRGGTHDQNLILWDGIKIYQSGHFFGLISTMNPRMTKRVSLYKNGTPASYSDGVSGTVDMKTDYDVSNKLSGEVGINFINLDAFIDVPIHKKSSLQLASRTSLNEFLNTPTYLQYYDRAFQNTDVRASTSHTNSTDQKFDFHDFSLRWLYDLTEKDKLRLNFLHLSNNLVITENAFGGTLYSSRQSTLAQKNYSGGLNYSRKWNKKLDTEIQLYTNKYDMKATNFDIMNEQILTQGNEVLESGILASLDYKINDIFNINGGYQFTESGITNSNKVNAPAKDEKIKEVLDEHSLFASLTYNSIDYNTFITAGIRASSLDTLEAAIIEPRVSFNHKFSEKFSLQILGEYKHQATTMITDSRDNFLGIERRRWKLADGDSFPVLTSKQVSLGGNYSHKGLMTNAEIYAKKVDGLSALSQDFQNQYEYVPATGSYFVKGLDFIINNKFNDLSAWLSYSYADNEYTFEAFKENAFPSNLDIRHTFNLGGTYTLDNFKFSAGYQWRTGKPTTMPLNTTSFEGNTIYYQDANSSNLPAYQRLDASVIADFTFSGNVQLEAGVSLLNILHKKNLINTYYYINNDKEIEAVNEYSLGFTPNIALRLFIN